MTGTRIGWAVVLCAGGSRRMGRPKGLLALSGVPMLRRQALALGRAADRVVVVLGRDADAHRRALPPGVDVVENGAWARTAPSDSLALALRAFDVTGPCLVTPVDTAPARPETLRALLRAGAPAVPVDPRGRPGHPVLLSDPLVRRVRQRPPDAGLHTLLGDVRRVPTADPLVAMDFDAPDDWARFRSAWPGG